MNIVKDKWAFSVGRVQNTCVAKHYVFGLFFVGFFWLASPTFDELPKMGWSCCWSCCMFSFSFVSIVDHKLAKTCFIVQHWNQTLYSLLIKQKKNEHAYLLACVYSRCLPGVLLGYLRCVLDLFVPIPSVPRMIANMNKTIDSNKKWEKNLFPQSLQFCSLRIELFNM